MRLIDADKLRHELIIGHDLVGAKYTDMADTIEAIPIEWIKNYASHKASKDLINCYWHFWEDDVLKMIDVWEKENGKD